MFTIQHYVYSLSPYFFLMCREFHNNSGMFEINDSAFQNYQKLQKQYHIIQNFNVLVRPLLK